MASLIERLGWRLSLAHLVGRPGCRYLALNALERNHQRLERERAEQRLGKDV